MKSQEDLERAVRKQGGRISQPQISQLERDNTKAPRALPYIARALKTTVDWLTEGIGDHAPKTQSRFHFNDISPTSDVGGIVTATKPLLIYRSAPGVGG